MLNEVLMKLGSWDVRLGGAPREITDALDHFGHVAVTSSRIDIAALKDEALVAAEFVGVKRRHKRLEGAFELGGVGMAAWLGDEDGKGEIFETAKSYSSAAFATVIADLLPASVTAGQITALAGTYTGTHRWVTPRQAIDYVCDIFDAEWRVNGDGTLDAGLASDLFVSSPRAIILARGGGSDIDVTALEGDSEGEADVEDWTDRVILLAEGAGDTIQTGSANIASNPYVDLHGNPVKRSRIISESETASGNATTRAQLHLNRFSSAREAVRLTSVSHEIVGPVNVGDSVYVYDPDTGFVNPDNEIVFRGQVLHPAILRVVSMSRPVSQGRGVYFRRNNGNWLDLTPYVEFESGDVTVDVGARGKRLTSSGEDPSPRVNLPEDGERDAIAPNVPVFDTPFTTSSYIDTEGRTRAVIRPAWQEPTNPDGSVITDGSHYVLRYRRIGEQ